VYADAYALLAYTYGAMAHYGMMPSPEAFDRVETASRQALKLQPGHGLALAQLASVESFQRWHWPEGERLFRDALAAAPRDADIHNLFGIHLRALGRYDEAAYEMRQARALEPITRHYAYQVAQVHLCAGFPDSALAEYRKSAELGVEPVASHLGAAEALGRLHRWDEALAEWATGLALSGDSAGAERVRSARGRAGYEALRRVEDEDRLRRMLEAAARSYVPSSSLAAAHASVGHAAEALRWLRRALSERDVNLIKVGCTSGFDPIRSDPEFRRIAAVVGVPPDGARPD
jgi:tetratricopeptide (TPR) repeat protein